MNELEKLVQIFSKFPGVGKRQAKRFVYYLLTRNTSITQSLIQELHTLHEHIAQCKHCMRFFEQKSSETLCKTCASTSTDKKSLLVVEKDVDLENMERSGVYNGRYFVIGGTVPILEKEPERVIRSNAFASEIKRAIKEDDLKEIIFALSATPEGEYTSEYLKKLIADEIAKHSLTASALGRGLSTGSELEYIDEDTLKNALKNRGAF
jgi:recombination protein RecR